MCVPYFGYWVLGEGVSPKGLVHKVLIQFFTLGSSKTKMSESCFSDIMTTHNGHPSYAKHVSGSIYVFFAQFGHWVC